MTRRKFIASLSSTAVVWPLVARSQPQAARLGVLLFSSSDPQLPAIQDRLRELGYVLGKNLLGTQRTAAATSVYLSSLPSSLLISPMCYWLWAAT